MGPSKSAVKQGSSPFTTIIGAKLLTKNGLVATEEVTKGKKFVMLYFSAHWCPPCRGFTPQLAAMYTAAAKDKDIEVVFVSSDRDSAAFDGYYKEMPWAALPFDNQDAKKVLSTAFSVTGIPCLVILDGATGALVTKEGRAKTAEYFGSAAAAVVAKSRPPEGGVSRLLVLCGYLIATGLMKFGDKAVAAKVQTALWVVLAIHLGEFLVKLKLFQEDTSHNLVHHFKNTMIYGFFYWKPIEKRLKAAKKDAAKKYK